MLTYSLFIKRFSIINLTCFSVPNEIVFWQHLLSGKSIIILTSIIDMPIIIVVVLP